MGVVAEMEMIKIESDPRMKLCEDKNGSQRLIDPSSGKHWVYAENSRQTQVAEAGI